MITYDQDEGYKDLGSNVEQEIVDKPVFKVTFIRVSFETLKKIFSIFRRRR